MEIHIGEEIEKIYRESGMKLSEFAKRINTSSRNVYSIFKRREIKTDQLQKIGQVLGVNFFSFYQSAAASSSSLPVLEEPRVSYDKNPQGVTILLKLDGMSSTLNSHIRYITAINQIIGGHNKNI